MSYTKARVAGISPASIPWLLRCSKIFWEATQGLIRKDKCDLLRERLTERYTDFYARRKVLNFARAFLKYLAKTRFDSRFQAFELFLELPKGLKIRKHVTNRIVTTEDVEKVLSAIERAYQHHKISQYYRLSYRAFVLTGAFTGQRPLATMARLRVGQFAEALEREEPVLDVLPEQDKIRMQHFVPLHPQVIEATRPLLAYKQDDELLFDYLSLQRWLKGQQIPLFHSKAHFVMGDLRKFCEQYGDIIEWEQANRSYILTHNVSSVDWTHYRRPLAEFVYSHYMKYWGDVQFDI